jgi:hypothetical protein
VYRPAYVTWQLCHPLKQAIAQLVVSTATAAFPVHSVVAHWDNVHFTYSLRRVKRSPACPALPRYFTACGAFRETATVDIDMIKIIGALCVLLLIEGAKGRSCEQVASELNTDSGEQQ